MFNRRWDGFAIVEHIMSSYGREALNSHYYAMAYPAVYAAAERIFGSWGNAIEACGLDYDSIKKYRSWSKEKIIAEIRAMHADGKSLSSNHVQRTNRPLYMAAIKRFRNWGATIIAAGIDYRKVRLRRKMSTADIKKEIRDLYRRDVDLAYPYMKKNHLYLLAAGMKKLGDGSWAKARRKCGIRENYRMYVRRAEIRTQMKESA